jgi:hypothetical protein
VSTSRAHGFTASVDPNSHAHDLPLRVRPRARGYRLDARPTPARRCSRPERQERLERDHRWPHAPTRAYHIPRRGHQRRGRSRAAGRDPSSYSSRCATRRHHRLRASRPNPAPWSGTTTVSWTRERGRASAATTVALVSARGLICGITRSPLAKRPFLEFLPWWPANEPAASNGSFSLQGSVRCGRWP